MVVVDFPLNIRRWSVKWWRRQAALALDTHKVVSERQFVGNFGLPACTMNLLWAHIRLSMARQFHTFRHLFWTLHRLKAYPTESKATLFWRTSRNTWDWRTRAVIQILKADLPPVR